MDVKIKYKESDGELYTFNRPYVTDVEMSNGRLKVNTLTGFTTFDLSSIVSMQITKAEN